MSEATELMFTLTILGILSCTLEERIKMESLFGFGHREHQQDNHGDEKEKDWKGAEGRLGVHLSG